MRSHTSVGDIHVRCAARSTTRLRCSSVVRGSVPLLHTPAHGLGGGWRGILAPGAPIGRAGCVSLMLLGEKP